MISKLGKTGVSVQYSDQVLVDIPHKEGLVPNFHIGRYLTLHRVLI